MNEATAKTVLLLGRRGVGIDEVKQHLGLSGVRLIGGTSLDDVQTTFAQTEVDHVIMGAGIDLDARLEIIREICQRSDTTTIHRKDRATGPEGFLPFIAGCSADSTTMRSGSLQPPRADQPDVASGGEPSNSEGHGAQPPRTYSSSRISDPVRSQNAATDRQSSQGCPTL